MLVGSCNPCYNHFLFLLLFYTFSVIYWRCLFFLLLQFFTIYFNILYKPFKRNFYLFPRNSSLVIVLQRPFNFQISHFCTRSIYLPFNSHNVPINIHRRLNVCESSQSTNCTELCPSPEKPFRLRLYFVIILSRLRRLKSNNY